MPILGKKHEERTALLQEYQTTTMHEVDVLDKIIHGCYQCFDTFEALSQFAMLYFAGADFTERCRRKGESAGFLTSNDPAFCSVVDKFYNQVVQGTLNPSEIKPAIEPWNCVGLCDSSKNNMYDYA